MPLVINVITHITTTFFLNKYFSRAYLLMLEYIVLYTALLSDLDCIDLSLDLFSIILELTLIILFSGCFFLGRNELFHPACNL